ncbi:Dbl homology domain-containing protein [Pilobolus umbonatus]|nr:Dbl homology domain-containing protein [Pilobolus umbonatus]
MPPHYPVESFQTKEWASATIDHLFTDNDPVSFEPYKSVYYNITSADMNTTLPPVRRSLSTLESTERHSYMGRPYPKSLQSDNSTSTTSTTSSTISSNSGHFLPSYSISAPSLLMTPPLNRSFSARLKRTLRPDRSILGNRMLSFKEKEGIEIWKRTFCDYLNETNKVERSTPSPVLSQFILNELVTTEITYLKHLRIIKDVFMDPLLEAATAYPSPLVNLRDIQAIFAFIPELIVLSSTLVDRLKRTLCTTETKEVHCSFGTVFPELENCFDIYIGYAANFSKQKRSIARADRSVVYRQLIQDSQRRKETNRMGLSDYMIAPIQRITRYGLLLKDLIKHWDINHPDHYTIQRTLKCHLALAHAMNEIQGK